MNQTLDPILPRHLLENFPTPAEGVEIEALKCPICLEICLDAVIESSCNHTFCKKCIDDLFSHSTDGSIKCPHTRNIINKNQIGPNRAIRDLVMKVKVLCIFKKRQCEWKGSYSDLEEHLKRECEQMKLKCKNAGCDFVDRRETALEHVKKCEFRPKQCKFCKSYFVANKLNEHQSYCLDQIIMCPYGCTKKIKKKNAARHNADECPNAVIECEFSEYGCEVKVKRQRYEEHLKENTEHHLRIMKEKTSYYKNQYMSLVSEVNLLRDASKIQEVKAALGERNEEVIALRAKVEQLTVGNQDLIKKNHELESTVKLLNNTEAIYHDQSYGTDEDEEESKEDVKNIRINLHDQSIDTPQASPKQGKNESGGKKQETKAKLTIIKEGWLQKKSKFLGEWRKRWIVLTPDTLYTFRMEKNYTDPTEKIRLQTIEQVSDGPEENGAYFLNIKMQNGNNIQFKAKRGEIIVDWLQKILNIL